MTAEQVRHSCSSSESEVIVPAPKRTGVKELIVKTLFKGAVAKGGMAHG
jgi:hypothetical protein